MSCGRSSSKSEDRNTIRVREIQNGVSDNKRCFDCHQRGPNYVNVSVGAFVCTKCSGMLRGVTPPHRIKSISMSTFTNEDVSLLDSRGNLWCQKVWLATYSGSLGEDFSSQGDETLKQHILDKYEKKRYYIDPSSINDLDAYSSSHLRQNSKTAPSNTSSSSHLIGSRISQKYNGSPSTNKSSSQGIRNGLTPPALNGPQVSVQSSLGNGGIVSRSSDIQSLTNMDPFGSSFSHTPSKGTLNNASNHNNTNNMLNSSASSSNTFEAFANFETANFESPPADPLSSFRSNTIPATSPEPNTAQQRLTAPTSTSSNLSGPALQPFNTSSTNMNTAASTSRTSSVVSPTMNSNTSTTSEDRYAALKDLDEIFRSVHVSDNNDTTNGGAVNFFNNASTMNGASSIFGSVVNNETSGGSNNDKTISSIFDTSPMNKSSNNDSWKRLSTNSSDNQGWANFGGSATTPSSTSSNAAASNPFSLGSNNFSQLNTSPWPTTGTSPVQSGNNTLSNGGTNNGPSDPFSVTNHSFQNSSEILTNDLFANAPKPNGSKGSNLNHHHTTGGNIFNSNFVEHATSNPWDTTPLAFTDNMKPSFNPKNPFL